MVRRCEFNLGTTLKMNTGQIAILTVLISLAVTMITGWMKLTSKVSTLEAEVEEIRNSISKASDESNKKEDKIMQKLEVMGKDIIDIKIELQNKQDRH